MRPKFRLLAPNVKKIETPFWPWILRISFAGSYF